MSINLFDLFDELDLIEEPDGEIEWEYLKNNYLKLRYINTVIKDNMMLEYDKKYTDALNHFLKQIDRRTRLYMEKIHWDEPDSYYYDRAVLIQDKFHKALKMEAFPVKKMKAFLKAYSLLVDVVEECRDESIDDYEIDDDDFLNTFKPPLKKQKIK